MSRSDEDALLTEATLTVAKVRLIEGVLGVFAHGLRVMALAPLVIALFASAMLGLTMTETHDKYLPPIVERLPANLQEMLHDEDMTWDEFGKAFAGPLIFGAFLLSVVVSLVERITGWRLRRFAPKFRYWILLCLLLFAGMTLLTLVNHDFSETGPIVYFVISLLNFVLFGVAAFSILGLWAVSRAETGSVEALYRRYKLVRVDDITS